MGTQEEIAIKPKPVKEKDTQKREAQRKMANWRNIKTENFFSILQEKDTLPLREEEELHQIVRIDKTQKKICEGKGRVRI